MIKWKVVVRVERSTRPYGCPFIYSIKPYGIILLLSTLPSAW